MARSILSGPPCTFTSSDVVTACVRFASTSYAIMAIGAGSQNRAR